MNLPDQLKPTSPVKAIRAYCLECCRESVTEVKLCPAEECPLHAFRFGKNPYYKSRQLTDEEKQKNAERLRAFKLQKSQQTAEENFAESSGSINSHPSMSFEENALAHGKYPVYPDFPEEHWD